jgi:hypothetical protein
VATVSVPRSSRPSIRSAQAIAELALAIIGIAPLLAKIMKPPVAMITRTKTSLRISASGRHAVPSSRSIAFKRAVPRGMARLRPEFLSVDHRRSASCRKASPCRADMDGMVSGIKRSCILSVFVIHWTARCTVEINEKTEIFMASMRKIAESVVLFRTYGIITFNVMDVFLSFWNADCKIQEPSCAAAR